MCFTSNLEDKPKQNQHRSGDANPDQNSHCLFQLQWNMDWEHIKIKTRTTNFRSRLGEQGNQHGIWIGNIGDLALIQDKKK